MGLNIDLVTITDTVQHAGFLGIAIMLLIARYRGWWVDGPTHQRVIDERDKLMTLAFMGSISHERTTGILERVAAAAPLTVAPLTEAPGLAAEPVAQAPAAAARDRGDSHPLPER